MPLQHKAGGIIVGVDGSPSSIAAVEWAAKDAELRGVALKAVHVVAPLVAPVEEWSAEYAQALEAEAQNVISRAHNVAIDVSSPSRKDKVTSEVVHAPPIPTLVDMSMGAGMIVVGCRGQGAVANALLGSVSSGLVHHAHCPVAVIHDEGPLSARSAQAPVVVGIDGSPTSELAAAIAFDEASRRGVGVVALHAWSDMGPLEFPRVNWAPIEWRNIKTQEEAVLAERLCGWQERYPDVVVDKVVVSDRPAPRLLEQAESAQLVVVGSHGRGGFPGMLLGSVSRAVVNSAKIPVIVARMPQPR